MNNSIFSAQFQATIVIMVIQVRFNLSVERIGEKVGTCILLDNSHTAYVSHDHEYTACEFH
jgi:hypothetical protein